MMIIKIIATCLMILSFAIDSNAIVVTFDDITSLSDGYAGFNWKDIYLYSAPLNDVYPAVSGTNFVRGFYDGPIDSSFSRDENFDFIGAYFTSQTPYHYRTDEDPSDYIGRGDGAIVSAYRNGDLVYRRSIDLYLCPTWVELNLNNVDSVHFSGVIGSDVFMDNFTYYSSSPVPEPATLFLLGGGLAGLVIWRRRWHN